MEFSLNVLREAVTVVSFVLYVAIVGWAWSSGKAKDFEQAAALPFEAD